MPRCISNKWPLRAVRNMLAACLLLLVISYSGTKASENAVEGGDPTALAHRAHTRTPANMTRIYSPITLSREWSTLGRLVAVVFFAIIGATLNGFFISAFFVEYDLKRIGAVFHACVGIADMFITGGIMPLSAIVLLSGVWDITPVCKVLHFLMTSSSYLHSLFFTLVACEAYFRVCRTLKQYEAFLQMRIYLMVTIFFMVGLSVGAVGTFFELDDDYCERHHHGNFYYRMTMAVLFYGIPFLITSYTLIATSLRISQPNKLRPKYRRSFQYFRDLEFVKVNIMSYALFILSWIPHATILAEFPDASDSHYYQTAWLGLCRPIFTCILYGSFSTIFSNAYANLFYYCCCKSTLNGRLPVRHRRTAERGPTDVRVHIMHQAAITKSPHRSASSTRETQDL